MPQCRVYKMTALTLDLQIMCQILTIVYHVHQLYFLNVIIFLPASVGFRWMIGQTEIDRASSYGNKNVPSNNT